MTTEMTTEEISGKMESVDIKDGDSKEADVDKKREDYLEWSEYFMAVSFLSAMRSKDPATQVSNKILTARLRIFHHYNILQVGACIVNPENRIVGIGYNGMPRGCSDDLLPWGKNSKDE